MNTQNLALILRISLSTLILSTFSHMSHADIEQISEESLTPDFSPIRSLKNLQSLKNLKARQETQTPFVQELNNALKVRTLFVETHDLPIVDIQLTFNAGSAQDETLAQGLFGTANMAAKLMLEGTDQYTAKQINNTFESLGAKVNVSAHRDMFIVRLRVLSEPKKLNAALNLLLHVIQKSNFNHSGLNLVISNTKLGQKQVQENPSRLMNIRFYRALYGQHPYAEPSVGTHASIRKISPELLQQFRNQLLVAQNSNIAITGDLSASQATEISNIIAQALPQGSAAQAIAEPIESNDFNISFIPHQSSQAYITMGHLGISRNHPDRVALEVANRIFGGSSFNSILSKELRVKRGLTYSASSMLTTTQVAGVFSLSYSTQQDKLMESIQVAHQSLTNFITQPITQQQLNETKEGMLYAYPMTFSSNANINAQIAAIAFYGLPTDYLNIYQKKINSLSLNQLQSAIKKHLHADKLTIVIVANTLDQDELKRTLNQNLNPNTTQ